jgi:thiamine-phosphate pyrophosphorylase
MPAPVNNIVGLYLISDTAFSKGRSHEEVVRAGVAGGARVIQVREKSMSLRELFPIAVKVRELTREAGVLFIVNDSVELAMAVGADGVHLGQGDMPVHAARGLLGEGKLIGVSTHNLEEALKAEEDGADYIGFGPIFKTGTKDAGEVKGPEGLMLIRDKVGIPVVAIGGINAGNAGRAVDAGADAVAVISAVVGADDIVEAAREIAGIFG